MDQVFLNGAWVAPDAAKISAFDRGFLFGDGIYEVIPVYNSHPFRFDKHLTRLKNNIAELKLPNPYSDNDWQTLCQQLIDRNGGGNLSIYLQLTRGSTGKRAHVLPPLDTPPTVFATCNRLAAVPADILENGVRVTLLEDIRWQWCHIKSISLLGNLMLADQATQAGASEALLKRGDKIVEGATSNVFAIKDGMAITPPKSHKLLPGITRDLVIELLRSVDIPLIERDLSVSELDALDELWICSSTREIYPVTNIDGNPVGDGRPGVIWAQCLALYQSYKSLYKGE
jgi:D-alanine transaminase